MERERESYLEMALKMQYPKVYADMIKNDHIVTNTQRTQRYLDEMMPRGDYENGEIMKATTEKTCKDKQLNEVLSGKQRSIPLSNPMRFLAQEFANNIANNSTASPERCQLLFTHLSKYINKISLYLSRKHKKFQHLCKPPKKITIELG